MIPFKIKRSFQMQLHQNDCGVACLKSLAAYYGLSIRPSLFGVLGEQGISLFKLKKEMLAMGLTVKALELCKENLSSLKTLSVITLKNNSGFLHAVVFYPTSIIFKKKDKILIGDPALGLHYVNPDDLKFTGYVLCVDYSKVVEEKRKMPLMFVQSEFSLKGLFILFWGVLSTVLSLFIPIYIQRITDKVQSGIAHIGYTLCFLILCVLLKNVIQYLKFKLSLQFSYEYQKQHFTKWFSELKKQSQQLYQQVHFHDFKRLWKEHHALNQMGISYYTQIGNDFILYVLWMALCSYYLPYLFFILFIGNALLFVLLWLQMPDIHIKQERFEQEQHRLERDYMYWIKQKQLYGLATGLEQLDKSVERMHENFYLQQMNYADYFGRLQVKIEGYLNCISYGAVILLLQFYVIGSCSTGVFMSGISIIYFQMPVVQRLMNSLKGIYLQQGYHKRRMSYFNFQTQKETNVAGEFEKIKVFNLGMRKNGKGWLFQNLSLSIERGDFISVWGRNGSGKSSLIRILLGILEPDAGDVLYNGCRTNTFGHLIGYLPQEVELLEGTLCYNITLSSRSEAKELEEFFHFLGVEDFVKQFPHGLATRIIPDVKMLSGGQMKIVGLLRVLYRKPQILFLDEPDSFLDSSSKQWLYQILKQLKGHITIVLISHDEDLIALSGRWLRLSA